MDTVLAIGSLALLIGLLCLGVWIFKKIMQGKIGVSVTTALLALLVIILLVPFAMNLSAHYLYEKMHHLTHPTKGADESN
ncbi:MAG: hypothetical protein ACREUR_03195 [Nitrosospira sp.]